MASARPNPLAGLAHSATRAVEENVNTILSTIQSNTLEAMDAIASPFLRLPVELQTETVSYLSNYSDLRALRLVSKRVSDIATPHLYNKVDLRNEKTQEGGLMVERINSLLVGPANLRFVRILKIPPFGLEPTQLMDQVLPLLRKDFMTEFSFITKSTMRFPTPLQMQFLWARQENLQNLKLYSHMVPCLSEFLEFEPSRIALLQSFTKLDISDKYDGSSTNCSAIMIWPLRNLDLRVMQDLQLYGRSISTPVLSLLNDLFARGSFVNITKLTFAWIRLNDTLTLTNMPSLNSLVLHHCRSPGGPRLFLAFADDLRVPYFSHSNFMGAQMVAHLLIQMKGLKHLAIMDCHPIKGMTRGRRELALAINIHKDTLLQLKLREKLSLETGLDAELWHSRVVETIAGCRKLVDLSLPLVPSQPLSYYRNLIASFPDLASLTIYGKVEYWTNRNQNLASELFLAATQLKSVNFRDILTLRDPTYPHWYEQNFVRKDPEQNMLQNVGGYVRSL